MGSHHAERARGRERRRQPTASWSICTCSCSCCWSIYHLPVSLWPVPLVLQRECREAAMKNWPPTGCSVENITHWPANRRANDQNRVEWTRQNRDVALLAIFLSISIQFRSFPFSESRTVHSMAKEEEATETQKLKVANDNMHQLFEWEEKNRTVGKRDHLAVTGETVRTKQMRREEKRRENKHGEYIMNRHTDWLNWACICFFFFTIDRSPDR